jgi:hypothetical protein
VIITHVVDIDSGIDDLVSHTLSTLSLKRDCSIACAEDSFDFTQGDVLTSAALSQGSSKHDISEDVPMRPAPVPQGSPHEVLASQARHIKIATNLRKAPSRRVRFSLQRFEFGVQPYSEIYGMHPREFEFDEFGNKMQNLYNISQPLPFDMTPASAYHHDRLNESHVYGSGLYDSHVEWGAW